MDDFLFGKEKAAIDLAKHLSGNKHLTKKVQAFFSNCQLGFKWLDKINEAEGNKSLYVQMLMLWNSAMIRIIDEDIKIEDKEIKLKLKSIVATSFRIRFRKANKIKSKHDGI